MNTILLLLTLMQADALEWRFDSPRSWNQQYFQYMTWANDENKWPTNVTWCFDGKNKATLSISTNMVTNWVSVSRTLPLLDEGSITLAVYTPIMTNQHGDVTTNRVMNVIHAGVTNSFPIAVIGRAPPLSRSIDLNTGWISQ